MLQPVPHPISGIYYLRRKVPDALRAALGREYKKSLKTRDPLEARIRFTAALAQSDVAFALARAQNGGTDVLGQQDAQQIAARWFRAEQERMDNSGAFENVLAQGATTSVDYGDGIEEATSFETLQAAASADPTINLSAAVHSALERAMRREALPVPPKGSTAYRCLSNAFEEHLHKLSAWALDRWHGDQASRGMGVPPWAPIDAQSTRETDKPEKAHTLRDLFAVYAEDKTLTDGDTRATRRSLSAYRAIVEGFIELHGELPVVEISRAVIAQYRASLAKLPTKGEGIRSLTATQLIEKADREGLPRQSEATIRNRLRAVSAVLSCGVRLGWVRENPVIASGAGRAAAKAATRRQASSAKRNHYSPDELRAIFSSPIYSAAGWSPLRADFGRAWYWLPLLLYYTGARREELAQLVASEVQHDADAGWNLSILATADEDDDRMRGVKTVGSRRRIPLHTDLIARGFIDYVRSVPAEGQLFPQLRPDPAGYFGQNFGKRWAVYLRKVVKLDSPARPSHGFRHTFKTLCRAVGIHEDVNDAITGHAGESKVARGYGEMPLARMAQELRRYPLVPLQPPKQREDAEGCDIQSHL